MIEGTVINQMPDRIAVPFAPVIRGESDHAAQAAEQLNELIAAHEKRGYLFSHIENANTYQPGTCLAGQATSLTLRVAVFERQHGSSTNRGG